MDEAVLSGLHGLRETPPGIAEVLAAFALGLLIASAVSIGASMFRSTSARPDLAGRLAHLRTFPEQDRAIALAGMLKELTDRKVAGDAPWPERAASSFGLGETTVVRLGQLYETGPALDSEALERAIRIAERY